MLDRITECDGFRVPRAVDDEVEERIAAVAIVGSFYCSARNRRRP